MRASLRVDDAPRTPILSSLLRSVHSRIEVYRQDMLLEFSGTYESVDNAVIFHVERKLADDVVKVNFGGSAGLKLHGLGRCGYRTSPLRLVAPIRHALDGFLKYCHECVIADAFDQLTI